MLVLSRQDGRVEQLMDSRKVLRQVERVSQPSRMSRGAIVAVMYGSDHLVCGHSSRFVFVERHRQRGLSPRR